MWISFITFFSKYHYDYLKVNSFIFDKMAILEVSMIEAMNLTLWPDVYCIIFSIVRSAT